jgi:gliding motility-associated-like protein
MIAPNAIRFFLVVLITALSFNTKAQVTANFSATPVSGCAPLIVSFTDMSAGNPNQWRWDLGNATVSTLQNPATTYFNPGTYTVKLVVRNAAGDADSVTKTAYITVHAKPTVGFTGAPLTGCIPLPVQFTNQASAGSGSISSIQWDFGDGNLDNTNNPSHTYTAAGNFNVSLKVTNSFGCVTSLTKPQYVQVGAAVHAGFTNTQPANCDLPSLISFTNTSTGPGTLSYQWNFGDGGTSIAVNPSHNYTVAGTYTVTLIVTNNMGCSDTLVVANAVSIGIVDAAFTSPDMVCVNNSITFINTSTPAPSSVLWDFGDATTSTSLSSVKLYSTPGVYRVKLVAQFGNCSDSAFRFINVLSKPIAGFTANPLSSCAPPLLVNFNNTSSGGLTYQWDFGDGNTSAAFNPSHLYTAYGDFNVRLITTNINGCSDTLIRTAYVRIQAPEVTINNVPDSGCAPLTHMFTATVNSIDPVVQYEWDFGDGGTSTLPNPTHVFATGIYSIRLIITTAGGCKDTAYAENAIIASDKPVANFSANPRDVCAQVPVFFTDLSTGNVTHWLWSFGDGATSTQQNPTHIYEDTGYFHVQLIVWNRGCPDTIRFNNYIHIKPPIARFTPTFNCATPFIRVFTDQSLGADEWNWDFGDGNTTTVQSPTHTYAAPGTYTVTLLVRNHTTGCEYTRTQVIQVMDEKADFTESQREICRNSSIDFAAKGMTEANIASYSWDFGDGNTGSGKAISHVYTQSGTYSVRLVIVDMLGCADTLLKPLHIRVNGPVAAFAPSAPGTCSQSATVFTDNSTGDGVNPITSWIWNFGDGNTVTFTAPPFIHSYTTPGVYDVRLKVTDSKGCADSILHTAAITVSKPVALFTTPDTVSCPGKNITFSNTSTGPNLNHTWYFGDATTSTDVNPVHTYAADGIYDVKLVITDQYGCKDSMNRTVKIASPVAGFTMSDSVGTCPPLIVNFTNTSLNATSISWDFGDGTSAQTNDPSHFYSYPGIYNVKLSIESPGGCTHELVKQVIVKGPEGNFTYAPLTGCQPLQVSFTATTQSRLSFVWDFNDGSILPTTDSVLTYTYTIPGNYVPKMILVDAAGCQVPITGPDTIKVKGAVANFGFETPVLCDKGLVSFSDSTTSNDGIASYDWDFGDGQTSTQQNPVHLYSAPGFYYPRLVVTTLSGCKDTAQKPTPVKIVASPIASIAPPANGCAPLTATFTASVVADTSAVTWSWNFGNGNLSTVQNPPAQVYTTAAVYPVRLIVTNSSGCKDTVDHNIEAFIVPTVGAGIDTLVCRGSGITLHATGADNYAWTPSTGLSCVDCPSPVASPVTETDYIVTGSTIHGCHNTDTVRVYVKQPFVMQNSIGDTLCKGGSVRLFATGAHTYNWSPSSGLSSITSPIVTAAPSVTTVYRVIGTDDKRCFRDTAYIPVVVYNYPTVDAGKDKTISAGQTIVLTPTVSADVTSVNWSPVNTTVSSNYPSITVKPRETTTYFAEVVNAGGCKSRDEVTISILCDNANVFIPNTFSPNGDGTNDIFYVRGSGLFDIKSLNVFNRWGEVMFQKVAVKPNDAAAGWDGTYKGTKLPPDVYVYTAEVQCENGTVLVLKGNVALLR